MTKGDGSLCGELTLSEQESVAGSSRVGGEEEGGVLRWRLCVE